MKRFQLAFLLLPLLLSGCTFVRVINLSDLNARVQVYTPDSGSGYTRLVRAAGSVDVFAGHGGGYRVVMLPDEEYRALLDDIRTQITERLFTEGASLSAEDVRNLVQRLEAVDQALADLQEVGGSCRGQVPDFETAIAIVNWNAEANNWSLECGGGGG